MLRECISDYNFAAVTREFRDMFDMKLPPPLFAFFFPNNFSREIIKMFSDFFSEFLLLSLKLFLNQEGQKVTRMEKAPSNYVYCSEHKEWGCGTCRRQRLTQQQQQQEKSVDEIKASMTSQRVVPGGMVLRDRSQTGRKGKWRKFQKQRKERSAARFGLGLFDDDEDEEMGKLFASDEVDDVVIDADRDTNAIFDDEIEEDDDMSTKRPVPKEQEKTTTTTRRKRRPRRRRVDDDDDDDEYLVNDDEEKDDDDNEEQRVVSRRRVETSTLDDIGKAVDTNAAYFRVLLEAGTYIRGHQHEFKDPAQKLTHINDQIMSTLRAMEDLMPVTQTAPIEHPVPPTLPEADGTEIRFTNVANEKGIIWSRVDADTKQRIYERAAQLHKDEFGAWPKRVRMWTNSGYRPVYYYNKDTYPSTMGRALDEYVAQRAKNK